MSVSNHILCILSQQKGQNILYGFTIRIRAGERSKLNSLTISVISITLYHRHKSLKRTSSSVLLTDEKNEAQRSYNCNILQIRQDGVVIKIMVESGRPEFKFRPNLYKLHEFGQIN